MWAMLVSLEIVIYFKCLSEFTLTKLNRVTYFSLLASNFGFRISGFSKTKAYIFSNMVFKVSPAKKG